MIKFHNEDDMAMNEIGIDEAGRGPMFGPVYVAAVVLPRNDFKYEILKDSKKFTSKKKIRECADYIKNNALYYSITSADANTIDKINIRETTIRCMHESITNILKNNLDKEKTIALVDGIDFKPYLYFDSSYNELTSITVKGGDNKYCSIAAASILAKVARDTYIETLCEANPCLIENYDIFSNKGYGTKKHIDGIKEHGITNYHRKSFGLCQTSKVTFIID